MTKRTGAAARLKCPILTLPESAVSAISALLRKTRVGAKLFQNNRLRVADALLEEPCDGNLPSLDHVGGRDNVALAEHRDLIRRAI